MKRTALTSLLILVAATLVGQSSTITPSLILVHGLGGSEIKWRSLIDVLPANKFAYISNFRIVEKNTFEIREEPRLPLSQVQDPNQVPVFTITFEDNQNLSFTEQGQRLRAVVNKVIRLTGGRDVILFGHSMGGLASRACLMLNQAGIAGLVTAGTPHAGSFLAYSPYFRSDLNIVSQQLANLLDFFAWQNDLRLSSDAIRMLAPDSPEMFEMYKQTISPELPVVCIVSQWEPTHGESVKKVVLEATNAWLASYKTSNPSPSDLTSIEMQIRMTDGVVSVPSQYIKTGIANAADINPVVFETNRFHTEIPEDTDCMMEAIDQIIKMVKENRKNPGRKKSTVGFIIDSSGSMSSSDPQSIRKTAVEQILELLNGDENLFLVDFDGIGKWLNYDNWSGWNIPGMKDLLREIDSEGGTDVGAGLNIMRQALESSLKSFENTAVILLSDGMGRYSNEADWYANNGIRIYTVSYKDKADANLLENIASATAGVYIQANDESDVIAAFMQFNNDLMGLNKYISYNGNLNGYSEAHIPSFFVDKGTQILNAILNWSGPDKALTLISPTGKKYTQSDLSMSGTTENSDNPVYWPYAEDMTSKKSGPYPDISFYEDTELFNIGSADWKRGRGYLMVRIDNPEPGRWRAIVNNKMNALSNDHFLFEAAGSGGYILPLESLNQGGVYQFKLSADSYNLNLNNSIANVILTSPSGKTTDISRSYHRGRFQFYPTEGKGNYKISATISMPLMINDTIQRNYLRSILIGDIMPGYIAPVKQMIGSYIITDQGHISGNRVGNECKIFSPETPQVIKARGHVTHVNDNECTIRVTDASGLAVVVGDIVELNIIQWQNDLKP